MVQHFLADFDNDTAERENTDSAQPERRVIVQIERGADPAPQGFPSPLQEFALNHLQSDVLTHLLPGLIERLGKIDEANAESAQVIADRMVATIPVTDEWQGLVGPFYSANDVAAWRAVTRQQIHKLRKTGALLGLQTGDRSVVFPAWQFGLHGEGLPGLREVVAALDRAARDEWATALWLNTKTPRFDGKSAADLLKADRKNEVLAAARADAAGMAA